MTPRSPTFFKNITYGLTLFYYNAYSAFSGQVLYNSWAAAAYSVSLHVAPSDCIRGPGAGRPGAQLPHGEILCLPSLVYGEPGACHLLLSALDP